MTNKYFSNPNLINAALTAVNALENAGRAYEDVVEVLWNAVIEAETEDSQKSYTRQSDFPGNLVHDIDRDNVPV